MALPIAHAAETRNTDPEKVTITHPITGNVVGGVPRCSAADVTVAVEKARAAQRGWAKLPFRKRAKAIIRFHDLILKRRDELLGVIQSETGKSRRDAFVELFAVACEARYYAYNGGRFLRPRRIKSAIPFRDRSKVVCRPLGVVGIISPWNFPFILSVADTIPALLAGNGVVVKPASLTPLSAIWGQEKLIECGVPEDLLQVVTGPGRELGDTLVDCVDFVMFTGSTSLGRRVAERAAQRLIPYNLELGGKNAMLVLPDANIRHAVEVAIEGSFNNAGQVCVNFERIYVHERAYDPFVARLIQQTERIRLGRGADFGSDLGSLISEEQLLTVERHIADAISKGAQVLAGGKRRPDLGAYFYEPTILAGVTPEMTLYDEETFGPVISVYKVSSVEEGIRRVNASRYGLHAGVYSRSRRRGEAVACQLDAGTVAVNDSYMSWAAMDGPMGGFKESGVGRRHGPEGIRRFTELQTITTNLTGFQISSRETALAINEQLANVLALVLRLWRHVPFVR